MSTRRSVLLLSQRLGNITPEEQRLEAVGAELRSVALRDLGEIAENASDADLLIVGAVEPFDRAALESLPNLLGLVRRGVGHDNIDVDAATRLGIVVANVPDASIEEVSDHAFASLVALERRLLGLQSLARRGAWSSQPDSIHQLRVGSRRLSDLTLGIVGFGRIGAALARKARGAYERVLVYDVVPLPADRLTGVEAVSLHDVLTRSDHLSLHLPMTPENRHLIGRPEIAGMRSGAILANTSRGGLVDENALVDALVSGTLAGAALDVTEQEPFAMDGRLLEPAVADRLLLTAHSAAWSVTASHALAAGSVDAAEALLTGRRPVSVVNPNVYASPALRTVALTRAEGRDHRALQ